VKLPACQEAIMSHDSVPNDVSSYADAEADLIPTFAYSMKITPGPNR
jgi:hypothetical protein